MCISHNGYNVLKSVDLTNFVAGTTAKSMRVASALYYDKTY